MELPFKRDKWQSKTLPARTVPETIKNLLARTLELKNFSRDFNVDDAESRECVNDTFPAESDATTSDDDWLSRLKTSTDTHRIFEDPHPELIKELGRLGDKYKLQHMRWSHSLEKINTIIVSAKGITEKIERRLKTKIKKKFADCQIEFQNVDVLCKDLSADIEQYTCNPYHDNKVDWSIKKKATCGLLLEGTQPHKKRKRLFAVTSAHLLLEENEMAPFWAPMRHMSEELLMRDTREGLYKKMDRTAYALNLGQELWNLDHLPLIAYRHYQEPKASSTEFTMFMNDIAVIPLDDKMEAHGLSCLQRAICWIPENFKPLNPKLIAEMVEKRAAVFFSRGDGRKGRLVKSSQSIHGNALGHHITFVLEMGAEFKGGDSGTLIFTESDGTEYAVGLLKGIDNAFPENEKPVYQAIILVQALDEISESYRQLISCQKIVTRASMSAALAQYTTNDK